MTSCGDKDIIKEGKICSGIKTFDIPKFYSSKKKGYIWKYGGRINSTGEMTVLYRENDNFSFIGTRKDLPNSCPGFNYNLLYFNVLLMITIIIYLIKRNM